METGNSTPKWAMAWRVIWIYPSLSRGVVGMSTDGLPSRGRAKSRPLKNWEDTSPGRRCSPGGRAPATVSTPSFCS